MHVLKEISFLGCLTCKTPHKRNAVWTDVLISLKNWGSMNRLINDRLSTYFIILFYYCFAINQNFVIKQVLNSLICVLFRIYTVTQRFKDDLKFLYHQFLLLENAKRWWKWNKKRPFVKGNVDESDVWQNIHTFSSSFFWHGWPVSHVASDALNCHFRTFGPCSPWLQPRAVFNVWYFVIFILVLRADKGHCIEIPIDSIKWMSHHASCVISVHMWTSCILQCTGDGIHFNKFLKRYSYGLSVECW